MFRAFYLVTGESSPLYGFTNSARSGGMTVLLWCVVARRQISSKAIGRRIHKTRFDVLIQLLHSRGRIPESCLLKSNRALPPLRLLACGRLFRSRRYQSQPRRIQDGPPLTSIKIPCVPGRRRRGGGHRVPMQSADQHIIADPIIMHFFHCPSSHQGQFIRRHNHIRDAIMDQINDAAP
jgi:hypothetical protein